MRSAQRHQWHTLKRFRMVSALSSVRPSLRPSSRFSMTSSGQLKNRMKAGCSPANEKDYSAQICATLDQQLCASAKSGKNAKL